MHSAKEDISRISVQLTNYVASTRGAVPSSADGLGNFVRGYPRVLVVL